MHLVTRHAAKNCHEDHAGAVALFAAKRSPNPATLPHAVSHGSTVAAETIILPTLIFFPAGQHCYFGNPDAAKPMLVREHAAGANVPSHAAKKTVTRTMLVR